MTVYTSPSREIVGSLEINPSADDRELQRKGKMQQPVYIISDSAVNFGPDGKAIIVQKNNPPAPSKELSEAQINLMQVQLRPALKQYFATQGIVEHVIVKSPIPVTHQVFRVVVVENEQLQKDSTTPLDDNSTQTLRHDKEDIRAKKSQISLEAIFTSQFEERVGYGQQLLLGRAGVGKTTLSYHLAASALEDPKPKSTPLWGGRFDWVFVIPLRFIDPNNSDYLSRDKTTIVNMILWHCVLPALDLEGKSGDDNIMNLNEEEIREVLLSLLKQPGRVLLILDGLDELPKLERIKHQAIYALLTSLFKYPNLLVTSRPGYEAKFKELGIKDLKDWRQLEIIGFDEESIEKYVIESFSAEPMKSKSLMDYFNRQAAVYNLAHIPINLSMIVYLHQHDKISSTTTLTCTELYTAIFNLLLRTWLKEVLQKEYEELDKKEFENDTQLVRQFMSKLAYHMVTLHAFDLDEKSIQEIANNCIPLDVNNRSTLYQDFFRAGLLVKTTSAQHKIQKYRFLHRSQQEYFAAYDLMSQSNEAVKDIVAQSFFEIDYQKIFVFLIGLFSQKNATAMLDEIFKILLTKNELTGVYPIITSILWLNECSKEHRAQLLAANPSVMERIMLSIDRAIQGDFALRNWLSDILRLSPNVVQEEKIYVKFLGAILDAKQLSSTDDVSKLYNVCYFLKKIGCDSASERALEELIQQQDLNVEVLVLALDILTNVDFGDKYTLWVNKILNTLTQLIDKRLHPVGSENLRIKSNIFVTMASIIKQTMKKNNTIMAASYVRKMVDLLIDGLGYIQYGEVALYSQLDKKTSLKPAISYQYLASLVYSLGEINITAGNVTIRFAEISLIKKILMEILHFVGRTLQHYGRVDPRITKVGIDAINKLVGTDNVLQSLKEISDCLNQQLLFIRIAAAYVLAGLLSIRNFSPTERNKIKKVLKKTYAQSNSQTLLSLMLSFGLVKLNVEVSMHIDYLLNVLNQESKSIEEKLMASFIIRLLKINEPLIIDSLFNLLEHKEVSTEVKQSIVKTFSAFENLKRENIDRLIAIYNKSESEPAICKELLNTLSQVAQGNKSVFEIIKNLNLREDSWWMLLENMQLLTNMQMIDREILEKLLNIFGSENIILIKFLSDFDLSDYLDIILKAATDQHTLFRILKGTPQTKIIEKYALEGMSHLLKLCIQKSLEEQSYLVSQNDTLLYIAQNELRQVTLKNDEIKKLMEDKNIDVDNQTDLIASDSNQKQHDSGVYNPIIDNSPSFYSTTRQGFWQSARSPQENKTGITQDDGLGRLSSHSSPLLKGILPGQKESIYLREEKVSGDGNCGFTTLGVTREQVAEALGRLANDPKAREALSEEIREALMTDQIYTEEGIRLLQVLYHRQGEENKKLRVIRAKMKGLPHFTEATLEQTIDWLNDNGAPEEAESLRQTSLCTSQAEDALLLYCKGPGGFQAYVNELEHNQNLWLGYKSALLYAKTNDITLYIWMKSEADTNMLILQDYVIGEDGQIIHMLSTGRYTHFNLLVMETRFENEKQLSP